MKLKALVGIILAVAIVATAVGCTSKKKEEDESESSMEPSITKEELASEVDWGKAEEDGTIITAEDSDVIIPASPPPASSAAESAEQASFKSTASPDKVWNTQSQPVYGSDNFTLPEAVMLEDGSVGKLSIPGINLSVSVYETDDAIESLAIGLAHMKESSCWDGNVAIAGHNSGVNEYFKNLYTLKEGDEITLTTALGSRTYAVSFQQEIDEMDWTHLGRTEENVLTLITCVNRDASKRLIVRAVEKAS